METVMVEDTTALAGEVTPIDVCLYESPYPVPWVLATVNYPDEDFCDVEWSLPEGPYEDLYTTTDLQKTCLHGTMPVARML